MKANPPPASGVYSIAPDDGEGFQTYCDLDPNNDGGGWTLLLKASGTSGTFRFSGTEWARRQPLNPSSVNLDLVEAKLSGYAHMPFTRIRVGLRENDTTRWLSIPQSATSLHALFTGPSVTTTLGRDAWIALVAPPALQQPNCNREGANITTGAVTLRLGIIFNNETDCNSTDSFIGIGANREATVGNGHSDDGLPERPMMGYVLVR
jgi:hypothetical protein